MQNLHCLIAEIFPLFSWFKKFRKTKETPKEDSLIKRFFSQ